METVKIDFNKQSILFLRHAEGSSSVGVSCNLVKSDKGVLTFKISRRHFGFGSSGLADMTYYGFAYIIPKLKEKTIEQTNRSKREVVYSVK